MNRIVIAALAFGLFAVAGNTADAGLFGCCRPAPRCCQPAPRCCTPKVRCCRPVVRCRPARTCCPAPAPSCCATPAPAPCCAPQLQLQRLAVLQLQHPHLAVLQLQHPHLAVLQLQLQHLAVLQLQLQHLAVLQLQLQPAALLQLQLAVPLQLPSVALHAFAAADLRFAAAVQHPFAEPPADLVSVLDWPVCSAVVAATN